MSADGFFFPDDETLLIALSAGWIPSEIAARGARVERREHGLVVAPQTSDGALSETLLARGIGTATLGRENTVASCWAETLSARRVRDHEAATVVFWLPALEVAKTASEILRLGCARQELRVVGEQALLRVIDPPYLSVLRALERNTRVRAFRAVGERVLVELGYRHPLEERVRPAGDVWLVVPGEGAWFTLPDGPFVDVSTVVDVSVDAPPRVLSAVSELPRIPVRLRLSRAARSAEPAAFVLDRQRLPQLEALVRTWPDAIVERLAFAATEGERPRVIVRVRAGSGVTISEAEAFAPHPQVPNLLVPHDATLEPPLRRERLQALLVPDPGELAFVRPSVRADGSSAGGIEVERIGEAAFRPLAELVDYVVDRAAPALVPWIRSATFAFQDFETEDVRVQRDERSRAPRAPKTPAPAVEKPTPRVAKRAVEVMAAPITPLEAAPSALAEALAACEHEFLQLDTPADDPARTALWARMGELLFALDRKRDGALCLVRAVWESRSAEARAYAEKWAALEGAAPALIGAAPRVDDVRAAVASLAAGRAHDPAAVAQFLDRHDDVLDVRSLWLARVACASLAGGDRLSLARTRDRILARLARGLSVERDVPTFLRFVGEGREAGHAAKLVQELEALRGRIERTARKRSPVEAKPELTRAYVSFVLAWGLARLGAADSARACAAVALGTLDAKEPVHGFLVRAYGARVAQALEGVSPEAPLPASIDAELNGLEKFLRYKVDRLRQASWILEPHERLDPIAAFHRAETDPRGAALAELRGVSDPEALARGLASIVEGALGEAAEVRARVFDGALDLLPAIGERRAFELLDRVLGRIDDLPPLPRAQILEEALRVAGHYGDGARVRSAVSSLQPLLRAIGPEHAVEVAALLGGALRALRRVGLRDEAAALLATAGELARGDGTAAVVARVHLAGGLAFLGHEADARPTLENAMARLTSESAIGDRLLLVRALCRAIGHTSQGYALAALRRIEGELPRITDSFNTNSHFCLAVIAFVEALVLGYTSDELALGALSRRFLDDDEHLVRRRLHGDLRAS